MEKLDVRGLECPAPVLKTKEILESKKPEAIEIIVDNDAARQNVSRFLTSQNYTAESRKEGTDFYIMGNAGEEVQCEACQVMTSEELKAVDSKKQILVMITTNCMGSGDDVLGGKLMINFIKTLKEMGPELFRLVFVNGGVKLCVEDSDAIADIKDLEKDGVSVLVCGTCLTHFNLLEKKEVGETTNMLDIVTSLQVADKVINI